MSKNGSRYPFCWRSLIISTVHFGFNPNTYHLLIHSYYKFGFSRKIIETLLSKGADINQTDGKNTLLSILCKDIKTNFESVKYLVSHGAKISDQDINNASKNPACANYLRKRKDMKKWIIKPNWSSLFFFSHFILERLIKLYT